MICTCKKQHDCYKEEWIIVRCDCGGKEKLTSKKYTDKDINLSEYYIILSTDKFYSSQKGILTIIKNRLKGAFMFLCGKQYRLFGITICEQDLRKLKEEINSIIDE